MEEDLLQLGGNIELSGFSKLDGGRMIVLKKIIGNYAKRMSERVENFEKLSIHVKTIHSTEKNEKYELHSKLVHSGGIINGECVDRVLFVAVDNSLKKIMSSMK